MASAEVSLALCLSEVFQSCQIHWKHMAVIPVLLSVVLSFKCSHQMVSVQCPPLWRDMTATHTVQIVGRRLPAPLRRLPWYPLFTLDFKPSHVSLAIVKPWVMNASIELLNIWTNPIDLTVIICIPANPFCDVKDTIIRSSAFIPF